MTGKSCNGGNCQGHGCYPDKLCYSCKTRTDKYVFYDFEACQETGVHQVYWVDCEDFYGNKNTFKTLNEFCKFIFNNEHKEYTFIAHNAKG